MAQVIKISDNYDLVSTEKYPYAKWSFEKFNPVQSRLFEIFEGTSNVAIAASTSSGKTAAAEMYLAYEIRKKGLKGMYIGPLKALVKEKEQDWSDPSHHFSDLKTFIASGDYRFTAKRLKEMEEAELIVMTPEMLASRCRNSMSDKSKFLNDIGIIVFDESHLLTVPGRGDHIEVALMKLTELNPDVRIVLLSATMPNVDEICEWISDITGRDTYYLESTYRPCPLSIHYETYDDSYNNYDYRELEKVSSACSIVEYYAEDKFLIFVHTKKTGALMLAALKKQGIYSEFHSADLNLKERLLLEDKFKNDKSFRVMVATSTIAWGCYKHGSSILGEDGCPVKIEKVNPGDFLLCPVGISYENKKVIRVEDFKSENSLFIKLESGEEMSVTMDHKFWGAVARNKPDWVEAQNLKIGDFLATSSNFGIYSNKEFNLKKDEDLMPARSLIDVHLQLNKMDSFDFKRITNCDFSNFDYTRKDIQNFIDGTSINSELNEFINKPIVWSKVKSINLDKGGTFREIEVEEPHVYVGCGVISHNCNLPARRVVVTGVHRGLQEVENYDIIQEVGRAGRPKYDPRGDAYILVPESEKEHWVKRLKIKKPIVSTMLDYVGTEENPHYKTLAFHIVAEIFQGNVKTADGFKNWFKKSLAHFQDHAFDDVVVEKTLKLLEKCRAIYLNEHNEYQCSAIGKVASLFYYSPFDVSDIKRNFDKLFAEGRENDDFCASLALGNIDSYRFSICNKQEKEMIFQYKTQIDKLYGKDMIGDPICKIGCSYFNLMKGKRDVPSLQAISGALLFDLDRTMQVISSLESFTGGKWGKDRWFKNFALRIKYGVPADIVELCQLPNVGAVRAKRLKDKGINSPTDIVRLDENELASVMKCSPKLALEALESARNIEYSA